MRAASAVSISMARYRSITVLPARVRTAPPPPLPPAAVSTTGVPKLRLRSSTSSQVRRYDIRKARPAAEIEPERAIASRTATLPGPIRAPETRSSRILSRSLAGVTSLEPGLRFVILGAAVAYHAPAVEPWHGPLTQETLYLNGYIVANQEGRCYAVRSCFCHCWPGLGPPGPGAWSMRPGAASWCQSRLGAYSQPVRLRPSFWRPLPPI